MIAFGKGPCDEKVVHSAGEALVCDTAIRRWVLAATILGSSIAFIDGTVVNAALPVIQERLGASVRGAQWIGDRMGRRRVFVAGVGGVVFGLIEGTGRGLGDLRVAGALVLGAAMLVLFVVVERFSAHPMLPLDLFRSRDFTGANLVTFCLYAALTCTMFFLSFDLIQAQGFTPAAAGAALLPLIVLISLLSR